MANKTQFFVEPNQQTIRTVRVFDAPRELVWRCFSEKALLERWLSFPGMTATYETNELGHGGRWKLVQSDGEGNEHVFRGIYHGDQTPDQTIRTFEWLGMSGEISMEKATMTEEDGKTTLDTTAVYLSVWARDGMFHSGMQDGVESAYSTIDAILVELQREGA